MTLDIFLLIANFENSDSAYISIPDIGTEFLGPKLQTWITKKNTYFHEICKFCLLFWSIS